MARPVQYTGLGKVGARFAVWRQHAYGVILRIGARRAAGHDSRKRVHARYLVSFPTALRLSACSAVQETTSLARGFPSGLPVAMCINLFPILASLTPKEMTIGSQRNTTHCLQDWCAGART